MCLNDTNIDVSERISLFLIGHVLLTKCLQTTFAILIRWRNSIERETSLHGLRRLLRCIHIRFSSIIFSFCESDIALTLLYMLWYWLNFHLKIVLSTKSRLLAAWTVEEESQLSLWLAAPQMEKLEHSRATWLSICRKTIPRFVIRLLRIRFKWHRQDQAVININVLADHAFKFLGLGIQ